MVAADSADPSQLCAFFDDYPEDDELFNIDVTDRYGNEFAEF